VSNWNLSFELQAKIENMWFVEGKKKSEIFNALSKDRTVDKEDIAIHLRHFSWPKFTKVTEMKTLFLSLKA